MTNNNRIVMFVDSNHFKNYVRKIAIGLGIDKNDFEKDDAQLFIWLYDFEQANRDKLNALGVGSVVDRLVKKIRKLGSNSNPMKDLGTFGYECIELRTLLDQLEILCEQLDNKKLDPNFNILNYFDQDYLKDFWAVRRIVTDSKNKFVSIHKHNFVPSENFKIFVDKHIGKYGLYFLYNLDKQLLYIGKSISLGDRIVASIRERNANGYVCIALTNHKADMHVYEPYYILKEKPSLNSQFNDFDEYDEFSISLQPLTKSDFIKIYDEK